MNSNAMFADRALLEEEVRRLGAAIRFEPDIRVALTPTTVAGRAVGNRLAIHPMEGISLLPALAGRALNRAQPLFWEHEGNRAVRSGNWKIVSRFPDDWELYDIAADRVERNNVAAQHMDVVKMMAADWEAWAKRTNVDSWPGPALMPWGDDAPARGGARRGQ